MKNTHFLTGLLLLFFMDSSLAQPTEHLEHMNYSPVVKRHSEGTFSNDYSKYLETRRAQDFVHWLMNSERNGSPTKRHTDGTYTSDVSSYLQDQAVKDFITRLKSAPSKQE
uniref:Glucagon / GIP / secretin / VIP family domain-containing protein n=1 Tax=Electrophorus electricus TaxID=8005 RepID=A0AAY5EM56_ELEEL